MREILITALACVVMSGCGYVIFNSNTGAANANATNSNANAAKPANTNTAPANAASNANAVANTATKPTESGPKRIVFGKGATWGTENMTLAAGGTQRFVVGAKKGQFMTIEAASSDVKVTMVTKGKSDNENEPNGLTASLNANGDYIFEIHNPTGKEIKTSVRVRIDDGPP